jgi:hypothetical protein
MVGVPISNAIRTAAATLGTLTDDEFKTAFNEALASFLPSFHVASAVIYDRAATRAPLIDSLISIAPITQGSVSSDDAACAAHVCHTLDASTLRDGCSRIAQIKALRKAPSRNGPMLRRLTSPVLS